MTDVSDLQVREQLKRNLDVAYALYLDAVACFRSASQESGSVPAPDGQVQIKVSGRRVISALKKYNAALAQFSEFTVSHSAVTQLEADATGEGQR